jgi:hypothetical protein
MSIRRTPVIIGFLVSLLVMSYFSPVVDYPTYRVYEGQIQFSGELALADLEDFVSRFPKRHAGSENNLAAAAYVAERFDRLGLEVVIDDFETRSLYDPATFGASLSATGARNQGRTVGELLHGVSGRNVIGILRGQSRETVIIGAHRDTINTVQGAEDNGSGTVALLQLAEIMSQNQCYYTYVFASYDAEEIGLVGSDKYVQKYGTRDLILSVSLDMLGWSEADTVGFYPFESSGQRSQLWVYALARQLSGYENVRGAPSLWKDLWRSLYSMIPTDSDPFLKRGVPALGILAMNSQRPNYFADTRPIHTPGDDMRIVSAQTLELTGQFMERFLMTMESGAVDKGYTALYAPRQAGHVPPWFVGLFYGLFTFALAAITLIDLLNVWPGLPQVAQALRGEWRYIALSVAGAMLTVAWWYTALSPSLVNLPIILAPVIGLTLPATTILLLTVLRRRTRPNRDDRILVRSMTLLVLLIIGLPVVGLNRTIAVLLLPVLLGIYIRWVWVLAFVPLFLTLFATHMPNFTNPQAALFFFWSLCAWILPSVYAGAKR